MLIGIEPLWLAFLFRTDIEKLSDAFVRSWTWEELEGNWEDRDSCIERSR